MNENIDSPNIYVRKKLNVAYNETGFQTYIKAVNLSLKIFSKYIKNILIGKIKFQKIKYEKKKHRIYYRNEFHNEKINIKEKR